MYRAERSDFFREKDLRVAQLALEEEARKHEDAWKELQARLDESIALGESIVDTLR